MNIFFTLIKKDPNTKSMSAIALMTFFLSCSSMMVFSLLPTYLSEHLHVSTKSIGYLEALAMLIAFLAKGVSGILSDVYKTRKPFMMIGSIGSTIVKPIFALSTGLWGIFWARSLDRLSKGVRASPTEALVADLSSESQRGIFYGIRQSSYTLGAIAGGFIASVAFRYTHNYPLIFWCSMVPGVIATIILYRYVTQPKEMRKKSHVWEFGAIFSLPKEFWWLILVSFLLMLARFSETFVVLRVRDIGFEVYQIPLLFILYETVHALMAIPFGYLADRCSRQKMLFWGIVLLCVVNGIFLASSSFIGVYIGFMLWGLHMGITQGLLSNLVSRHAPESLRCSAFSIFYVVTGVALLLSNVIAGYLSYSFPHAIGPFIGGLIFTASSFTLLCFRQKKDQK
jgi:MFS family permease